MAISDQLTQLNTIKQNIKTAINNKGGSVGNNFNTYAAAIAALPTAPAASEITYGKADVVTIKPYDSTVKTIGDRDFQSWTHATGLVIDTGFETLESYACYGWINAESLNVANTITAVGDYALYGYTKCSALSLSNSLIGVGVSAFENMSAYAGKLILPASLKTLAMGSFAGWLLATELAITGLNVTTIPANCFMNWRACKKVTVTASVNNIASNAFANLVSCDEFICFATTPPTLNSLALTGLKSTCAIKVPAASLAAYQAAANWSAHASKMVGI